MKEFLSRHLVWNSLVGIAFGACLSASHATDHAQLGFSAARELLSPSPQEQRDHAKLEKTLTSVRINKL